MKKQNKKKKFGKEIKYWLIIIILGTALSSILSTIATALSLTSSQRLFIAGFGLILFAWGFWGRYLTRKLWEMIE